MKENDKYEFAEFIGTEQVFKGLWFNETDKMWHYWKNGKGLKFKFSTETMYKYFLLQKQLKKTSYGKDKAIG